MKTFVKSATIVAFCLLAFNLSAVAGGRDSQQLSKLPHAAQTLIKKHFSKEKVMKVDAKNSLLNKTYQVKFLSGTTINFDKNGQWTNIDCKRSSVPNDLVPKKVSSYVKHNLKGDKIQKISTERGGYKIGLSSGFEVHFDKNLKVTRVR